MPSAPSFKTTNLFEKSSPPVAKPIGGMRISLTSDVTIPPKAAPMITPTARSMALPLTANSLNSFHILLISSDGDDVDQFFWNDNHITHRFVREPRLNVRVRQSSRLQLLFGRCDRHLDSIPKFTVDLNDDFNFVLDQQTLIVSRPGLLGNI